MASLANKTALVTGASRGMGRATALALAAAGARVIIHYGRNADEAKIVVDQIRATGGRADAVATDLAAPDGAHVLAAQVRNLIGNRLDIFVSNAGISKAAPLESISSSTSRVLTRYTSPTIWRVSLRVAGDRSSASTPGTATGPPRKANAARLFAF